MSFPQYTTLNNNDEVGFMVHSVSLIITNPLPPTAASFD